MCVESEDARSYKSQKEVSMTNLLRVVPVVALVPVYVPESSQNLVPGSSQNPVLEPSQNPMPATSRNHVLGSNQNPVPRSSQNFVPAISQNPVPGSSQKTVLEPSQKPVLVCAEEKQQNEVFGDIKIEEHNDLNDHIYSDIVSPFFN